MFPFDRPRPIQKEFMSDLKSSLENGENFIAEVPTGVGKTAAVLSVSLEYALGNGKRVLFLTPRHSQHMIALETIRKINSRGYNVRATDMVGKKWFCNIDGIELLSTSEFNDYCRLLSNDERCEYYNATFSGAKLSSESQQILASLPAVVSSEEVKRICGRVCPYEIAMASAKRADVVIGDYFHLFSGARQSFLSRIKAKLEDLIVIFDEAHNLPSRIRGQLSSKLTMKMVERATKEAKLFGFFELSGELKRMKRFFREKTEKLVPKDVFPDEMLNFSAELERAGEVVKKERKRSYMSSVGKFIGAWLESVDGFARIYRNPNESGYGEYVLNSMDPSVLSKEVGEKSLMVLMSGTMRPLQMYADLLGIGARMKKYPSPFPRSNRLDIVITSVTTRYSRRGNETYSRIGLYIKELMSTVRGSMAFFFPSYMMMNRIVKIVGSRMVMVEKQGMSKDEKERFVRKFLSGDNVMFGVVSGSFSEGVDYPGNRIKLLGIVGLPLARPDLETKTLIDYYDSKFGKGWLYAYTYPAMNRVIQTAGRSIRSENDRAVVLYMDERYAWPKYRSFLPTTAEVHSTIPYARIMEFLG